MPYVMQSKGQQQIPAMFFSEENRKKLKFYNQVLTSRHAETWPVAPLSLVPFTPSSRPDSEPVARESFQFESDILNAFRQNRAGITQESP